MVRGRPCPLGSARLDSRQVPAIPPWLTSPRATLAGPREGGREGWGDGPLLGNDSGQHLSFQAHSCGRFVTGRTFCFLQSRSCTMSDLNVLDPPSREAKEPSQHTSRWSDGRPLSAATLGIPRSSVHPVVTLRRSRLTWVKISETTKASSNPPHVQRSNASFVLG